MKTASSSFVVGAASPAQFPEPSLPEVVFAGRSNVGKSSLINMLLGRKNLARTSNKPGKTREINFYLVNDSFRFADLPGYGYARRSATERDKWAKLVEGYLQSSSRSCGIIHLVDARHPHMESDAQLALFLSSLTIPKCVVATKTDKLKKGELKASLGKLQRQYEGGVLPVSSQAKTGRDEVWEQIERWVNIWGKH